MTYVAKAICSCSFICCLIAIVGCESSTHDREKELSGIKELFANSKIALPDDSTFLNWGFEREGYVFAFLHCPENVPMFFPKAREKSTGGELTMYEVMKVRYRNHDMGTIIPGSAKGYEWTLGKDVWYQENLQTSKGCFVQIEVFKGKAN